MRLLVVLLCIIPLLVCISETPATVATSSTSVSPGTSSTTAAKLDTDPATVILASSTTDVANDTTSTDAGSSTNLVSKSEASSPGSSSNSTNTVTGTTRRPRVQRPGRTVQPAYYLNDTQIAEWKATMKLEMNITMKLDNIVQTKLDPQELLSSTSSRKEEWIKEEITKEDPARNGASTVGTAIQLAYVVGFIMLFGYSTPPSR